MSCSCSFSFQLLKALPRVSPHSKKSNFHTSANRNSISNTNLVKRVASITSKPEDGFAFDKKSLAIHLGALLAIVEQPAMAVTGVNNQEDLIWVIIQLAIVAFLYFIVAPPAIMNWVRTRFYRRKLGEMYLQFMFIFIFFPGIILWAPFLNFRKFPRDPSMKYPWSTPEDPSKIKNDYYKYPFATPDDYE